MMKLFLQVQDKIAVNKKAPARRKAEDDYLLTTKLFCGYCGKFMIGESRKERLEILIAEEKMIKPKLSEEFIRFYLKKFRSLDMAKLAHRKILIETFVNSVYIFDDKLVITYNADEKTETVTLEEINGSIIECSGAPTKPSELSGGFLFTLKH